MPDIREDSNLRSRVAGILADTYVDTDYPLPNVDDVIDHALATAAADLRDRAEDMTTCNKVDTCVAQAEVLMALAKRLETP